MLQDEMTQALATMRVDYDQCQIKRLEDSNNPMLAKRKSLATKHWTTVEYNSLTQSTWRQLCLFCIMNYFTRILFSTVFCDPSFFY